MKPENYFALQDALHCFGVEITACEEMNKDWTENVDKDIVSSIKDLLNVVNRVLDDEKKPEIIKMMECDLIIE